MSTYKVHIRPVDNKVLSDALKEINIIMNDFDTKMLKVFSILEEEMEKLDDETANVIDEIMVRIIDDLPDRICFMNDLYSIASNASSDEYEEDIEEDFDEDSD